jgi:predicted transcriptional regulator
MQSVAALRSSSRSRYARGVRNPQPKLLERISEGLAADPRASRSEVARRLGISRATLSYYLRFIKEHAVTVKRDELKRCAALSQQDLVERIGEAAAEVTQVIGELRAGPTSPSTAGAVFKGYATLERVWRLLGEIVGDVAGPRQNIYIGQVQALLNQPVAASSLSPATRAALGLSGDADPK